MTGQRYLPVSINTEGNIVSSPAGWYLQVDGRQRYWDGELWTEHFAAGASPVTPATSAGESWFFKNRVLIGAGALMLAVLFIVLSNATSGSSGGTDVYSESYFIESVKGHTNNGVSEDTAKQIGHITCDGLNAGTPIMETTDSVASKVSDNYEWAGYVMLGGVRAYCPEHLSQMNAWGNS